jgi:hypothetical protein
MSHASKVKGHCHWQSSTSGRCQRRAKVKLECQICGKVAILACNFHRERLFTQLQDHIRVDHPDEYRAAMARAGDAAAAAEGSIEYGEGTIDVGR